MGSVSPLEFFGGGTNVTMSSADIMLDPRYRFWRVTNTISTTREVTFPPTATLGLQIGGPVFILANVGSLAFNYRDFEDALPSLALAAGKAIIVSAYTFGSPTLQSCMLQWAAHFTAFNYSSY